MVDGKEKLKFFKMQSDWIARVRLADPTQSMLDRASKITSVNMTGVFIETAMPFPIGSIIQLDITIPGSNEPVAVKGIIRYSNDKAGGKSPRGMAIEFVKGSENMQEVIREYLQNLQAPPSPKYKPEPAPVQKEVPKVASGDLKVVPAPQPKLEPVKIEKKVEVAPVPPSPPKKEEIVEGVDSELEEVLEDIAPEPKPKVDEMKEEKREEERKSPPPHPQVEKKKSYGEETKHWY